MSVGAALRYWRKKRNIKQQAVASEMGISISAISYWERDRNEISQDKLEQFAKILGVSVRTIQNAKIEQTKVWRPFEIGEEIIGYRIVEVFAAKQVADTHYVVENLCCGARRPITHTALRSRVRCAKHRNQKSFHCRKCEDQRRRNGKIGGKRKQDPGTLDQRESEWCREVNRLLKMWPPGVEPSEGCDP